MTRSAMNRALRGVVAARMATNGKITRQRPGNGLKMLANVLIALGIAIAVLAIILATQALRIAQRARSDAKEATGIPAEARKLIREMEDVLDKIARRQASESMRKLRAVRSRAEEPEPPEETEQGGETSPAAEQRSSGDLKAELWRIVRARGMAR